MLFARHFIFAFHARMHHDDAFGNLVRCHHGGPVEFFSKRERGRRLAQRGDSSMASVRSMSKVETVIDGGRPLAVLMVKLLG